MFKKEVQLGNKVRDLVTGIEGTATAFAYYLNGCERVAIEPPAENNKVSDKVEWADIQQVQYVDEGIRKQMGLDKKSQKLAGGPQKSDAPKN